MVHGMSDDRVTPARQAVSDRQQNVWWRDLLEVSTWHDRSYITMIPLLAHGLTVKLTHAHVAIVVCHACLCGHFKYILLLTQACPRMMQHLSSLFCASSVLI